MIYKYKMKLDGESIKVYLMLLACAVVGIGGFFVASTIVALIILAVCIYVASLILKVLGKALSARITTYTDGFSVRMADGNKLEFEWELISYAGYVKEGIQKGYIFVYCESIDKFVQLPPSFENLEGFRAEIEEHHPVEDCVMKPSETIRERIKSIFVPETEDSADSAEDTDDADDAPHAIEADATASETEEKPTE